MNQMLFTVSALVLFALSDGQQPCGLHSDSFFKDQNYIVGGSRVDIADSVVSLQVYKSDEWWNDHEWKHVCGGTLLNNRWVLTSAHCAKEYRQWGTARVSVGSNRLENGQQIRVKRVQEYPNWGNKTALDIALIELQTLVRPNQLISPACVSTSSSKVVEGEYCVALGWGKEQENGEFSTTLKSVNVNPMTTQQCMRAYRNMNGVRITNNNLCAGRMGEIGQGICQGDLGGPLFCRTGEGIKLIGVATNGALCGSPQHPGVYVRVENFIDWIRRTTGDRWIGESIDWGTTTDAQEWITSDAAATTASDEPWTKSDDQGTTRSDDQTTTVSGDQWWTNSDDQGTTWY